MTTDEEDSENDEDLSETETAPARDIEASDTSDEYEDCEDDEGWQTCSEDAEGEEERVIPEHDSERTERKVVRNESHLVQGDELLEIFKSIHTGKRIKEEQITIGLVSCCRLVSIIIFCLCRAFNQICWTYKNGSRSHIVPCYCVLPLYSCVLFPIPSNILHFKDGYIRYIRDGNITVARSAFTWCRPPGSSFYLWSYR